MEKPFYFDNCATTACDPRVLDKMWPFFKEHYGNAASHDHSYGWQANAAIDEARYELATLIGAKEREIVFTSGATEAINLAIKGICDSSDRKLKHIITTHVEHKAVLDTCLYVETKGVHVTYLPVDHMGRLAIDKLREAVQENTLLVCIQLANNETGVVHNLDEVGEWLRKFNIPLFCDATQAVGKIAVDVEQSHIDLMAFSAHKMYGPKGIGALYVNQKVRKRLQKQVHGGSQEMGLRSGTLNTPGIVGFGEAARLCRLQWREDYDRLVGYRNELEIALLESFPGLSINGVEAERLPHVINFAIPGVKAEALLLAVSNKLALGRGSACSSAERLASHVLLAMGAEEERAYHSIRLSMGRFTKQEEVGAVVQILKQQVESL